MMANTGIPVLTAKALESGRERRGGEMQPERTHTETYAVACEAEVLAMTEALNLQDALPAVVAKSLAGVAAKLEIIVGADRDMGDPTDFPWPHIASVLRDLKDIAGDLPAPRYDRMATRADVARHWKAAVKLVEALNEETALERRKSPV
jgi:hypothetical protein